MSEDRTDAAEKECDAWLSAVDLLGWDGGDVRDLPPVPIEALADRVRGNRSLAESFVLAILDELRQTRAERDAARQELAAARAESALRLHELRLLLGALRDWFDALDLVGYADGVAPAVHALDAAARRAWDFHRAEAAMLPALPEVGA